ncbi:MAG: FHA domain-containing protein [Planctomycetes bacterium]|nr:FHA domain-containing protein [Planctomycetota bacterium]
MAKLIIKEGERKRIYEICEDTLHIGSTPENNIRLRDPGVSRVHCEIRKTPQGYRIVDLESKTGTKVNGEFINQHNLRHGDRVQIGRALLQFNAGAAAARAGLEPRESLRMERARTRKGLHPAVVTVICVAVLLVVALIVVKAGGAFKQYEGLVVLDKVLALHKSTDRADLEQAKKYLEQYEKLPAKEKTPLSERRYREYLEAVRTQLGALDARIEFKQVQDDYYTLSNQAVLLAKDGNYSGAIALLDEFIEKYPDSSYVRTMEEKKEIWYKKLRGEVSDFPATLTAIEEHIAQERYSKARHLILVARTLIRTPENIAKLNEADKKLQITVATQWNRLHKEAQEYADERNFRVAREIYNDIRAKWGIQKYVDLAKAELEKLKLRE